MKPASADISIRAYEADGLVLEQYAYTPGRVEPIPKHSHEEYQFALSFDHQGEYTYRGEKHQIPIARLSIIHSGEVHAPSARRSLDAPAHFAMANIHPKWLKKAISEVTDRQGYDPFFATVLPRDTQLNQLFLKLSNIGLRENSQLEQDVALFEFLFYLVQRHALEAPADISLPARKAIQQACDYLRAHCEQDVSLEELAAVVDLSRYHFCRLFRRETGVSVSTYQIQLRLARAKTLIMDGISLSEVAIATGFYDQSHFGKHFKRYVGTTPAKYTRHVQELS